ncbi:hypothetical protein M8C21_007389, partial [Ambrosia artemisiifolia]
MNSHLRQFGRFPDFSDRILYLTDGIRHVCRTKLSDALSFAIQSV